MSHCQVKNEQLATSVLIFLGFKFLRFGVPLRLRLNDGFQVVLLESYCLA